MGVTYGTSPAKSIFPKTISGLTLWLDGNDNNTLFDNNTGGNIVTADGTAVGRWQDKSGNNYHATQSSANLRAIFKRSIRNNKNTVRFDGVDDFYTGLSSALLGANLTNKFSIFIVSIPDLTGRQAAYGGGGILRKMPVVETDNSWYLGYRSNGSLAMSIIGNPNSISSNTTVVDDAITLGHVEYDGTAGANTVDRTKLFINTNQSAETAGDGSGGWGAGDGELGRGYTSSSYYFKNDLCEIIIYNKILSSTEKVKLENYLNNKWRIY
jgi:hypothetical protein